MPSIEIDPEVYAFLERHARPFLDTPNDVLRRLLLSTSPNSESMIRPLAAAPDTSPRPKSTPAPFDKIFELLKGRFARRAPYRTMFESSDSLLYVQNYGKETNHLWYRISEGAWKDLRTSPQAAWLCLSYPDGGFVYLIPVKELQQRVEQQRWQRPYLEVNIDPATSRWTELDWILTPFKVQMKA